MNAILGRVFSLTVLANLILLKTMSSKRDSTGGTQDSLPASPESPVVLSSLRTFNVRILNLVLKRSADFSHSQHGQLHKDVGETTYGG